MFAFHENISYYCVNKQPIYGLLLRVMIGFFLLNPKSDIL